MDPSLDASLVTQSINYHGQQLQKTWEAERGEDDLTKIGVGALDFAVYQSRHKHLTFQDRGKRLKLHQFIAKEANALFDTSIMEETPSSSSLGADAPTPEDNLYALMPPFETFLNVDKSARLRHFFDNVKTGELIIGAVINRTASGMMLKVLCTAGPTSRYVADINVKAFLPVTNIIPAVDKKNVSRNYLMNDTVCCEVIEVIPDTDKMVCGMKGITRGPDDAPPKPPLGLLSTDDFPLVYKKTVDMKGESYEAILEKSPGFNNPNCVQYLSELLGISNMHCTNFSSLRGGFTPAEYADELRQAQASKWAFRSVAEGIEHFKAGRHSEAFQCLNKALSIDPRNVEGLVARGALYANSGTFKKAIEDFETSLKLNPNHANARKYLGETLVALGRSYEDENKITEAQKAYEDCLAIIPFHEEAQNSLDFLKSKTSATKPLIEPAELLLPGLTGAKSYEMKETLKQLLNLTEKKDKKKKKKRGKGKKKRSSSSSSSSSDSSSSSSSSESSSSSSDSNSEGPNRKKKRRSQPNNKRQRSLSPLSKRMEMLGAPEAGSRTHNSQFNHPYGYQPPPPPVEEVNPEPQRSQADIDYELKVRKFLEMTKEDSDYEDKVRNFLEETAQYKRNRKMQELGQQPQPGADRDKKKKKKKDKSVPFTELFDLTGKKKKESKRKRKEQEREEKRKAKIARAAANNDYSLRDLENIGDKKLRDAIRKELKGKKRDLSSDGEYDRKHDKRMLDDMHGLEELESKLSAYHVMVEKEVLHKRDGRSSLSPDQAPPPPLEKPKWKMSMSAVKDTVKKKETPVPKGYKEHYAFEDSSDDSQENPKPSPSSGDKNVSVRRAMAMKEPPPLPSAPPPNKREPDPPGTEPSHPVRKGNIVLDKFGSFRLAQEGETPVSVGDGRPEQFVTRIKPPSPSGRRPRSPPSPRRHSSNSSDDERRSKRSRSRSRPRKYRSRSRSRSRSASSASGSVASRRRRSASPRSRSRSDASRSYYSRSRSRSRSGSRFRRFVRRGNWRGRGGFERGTYYRPRFHTYNGGGGRGRGRGGGDFRRDDGRRFQQEWRDNRSRGGRPFRPRRGGGGRGRPFRGGFRDFRDRRGGRYSRSRSPERTRRSRSYSPERRDKDRDSYSRYSERDSHRSEGEYEEERYVDRKEYDGKWADGNEPERNSHPEEKQPAEQAPKE
ncbi:tetratricopeptide repeat protein 14 homolog isoform X2 [Helicoverpa armigera]|uniref:tetratricopeptide repeat protein 14 homolog isoform X2 n=1 Tax=Helicoverpa armigera TaxID=29058 RepID=UPI000B3A10A0|nr:tetratricopeptide repeat protein 14 homolog isoform X2 [Helicoverpa armigera]XP_049708264.1 tetratricopeptide repeat protein 14 homolog isoform X2 [Helicoverpa armigera]